MQIFVKTLGMSVHSIMCEEDDTIMSIKEQLEKKYENGMPPAQQRLIYCGKQLEDERTIKDYSIFHNSTLHIVLRLRGGMQIFVKTLGMSVHSIMCEEDDTIMSIKEQLEKKYENGMPPAQQRLIYCGKQLEDERTIKDYSIFHNSTLHIVLRLRGGMQIFVKTLGMPVHAVMCEEDDTIMSIKEQLEKKYENGMPPAQQRLIYCGKQLEDERTIKDYSIFHNSTLHIVLRLRGGQLRKQ